MSRTPNVSTNVPANVPRRLTSPRKASYLVGDPSGWRFQMRLPASIRTADSFLAKSASTLRFRIGPMSRRAAEQQAGLYATICRAVFAAALQKQENREVQQNNFGNDNLVEQVVTSCEAAIAAAKETPSLALGLARGLDTALKTLNLVFGEVEKGEEGNPSIVVNADAMARDTLRSVLAYLTVATSQRDRMLDREDQRGSVFSWGWRPAMSWMLLFLWSWNGVILPVANATAGTSIVPIPWEHLLGFAGLWLAIYGGGHTIKSVLGR